MNTFFENFSLESLQPWFLDTGLKILFIIVGALAVKLISRFLIDKAVRSLIRGKHLSADAEEKRENTLISVFNGSLSVVLWVVVSLMVLSELGIDVAPLIAAAGVVGLALGFGGQYLIKDLISGLFILLENQYRVGDVITINETITGTVENFSLRMTILRDLDGVVHYVANGGINLASNKAQGFSRINLNVGVAYDSDIDKVKELVNKTGEEMQKDEEWGDVLMEAPYFLRVEDFGPSEVIVKILGKVKPGRQVAATGELRGRLKQAFDKEGIEIPFPQQVIHYANKN